jgi:hypothetical protein
VDVHVILAEPQAAGAKLPSHDELGFALGDSEVSICRTQMQADCDRQPIAVRLQARLTVGMMAMGSTVHVSFGYAGRWQEALAPVVSAFHGLI